MHHDLVGTVDAERGAVIASRQPIEVLPPAVRQKEPPVATADIRAPPTTSPASFTPLAQLR